jgi:GNAT superfamily N-acetyltransferase
MTKPGDLEKKSCQGGNGNLVISRMSEADRTAVLELVKNVYGDELTRKKIVQWEWLYGKNPNNPPEGPRAMVVRDGEKPVGLFRCIPVPCKVGDRYYLIDWNVDLMIHPEYRGKGLAMKLSRALLDEGDANTGLPLTNSPTYKILEKLNGGFLDVAPFPQIIRPFKMQVYARAVLKIPLVSHVFALFLRAYYALVIDRRTYEPDIHVKIEKINRFDSSFDDFWENVQHEYPVIVKRDSRYLNWKFFDRPDLDYTVYRASRSNELAGYIVLRVDERFGVKTGFVCDILSSRNDVGVIESLLVTALRHFREEGMDQVSAQVFFVATFRKVFSRMGLITKPSRRVRRIVLTINNESMSREVPADPENWFITRNYAHQEM